MTWGSPWDVSLIFSPGQRHEIEEKQQRALLREDEGVSADPPNRIDLDSGMVVIRLSGEHENETTAETDAHDTSPARTGPEPDPAESDSTASSDPAESESTESDSEVDTAPDARTDVDATTAAARADIAAEADLRHDRSTLQSGPAALTSTSFSDIRVDLDGASAGPPDQVAEPDQQSATLPADVGPAPRPTARRTRRPNSAGQRRRATPPAESV